MSDEESDTAPHGRQEGDRIQEEEEPEDLSLSSTPFRPKEPKFGGITQIGASTWVAWTGGKPNANWTELEEVKPKNIQPNQHRPLGITSQTKSQAYRQRGLETKFSRKSDLQTFQHEVLNHLENHGMDTVTYIEDPTNNTNVVSIISDHGKFTLAEGSKSGDDIQLIHFDEHDHSNCEDAKKQQPRTGAQQERT